MQDISVKKMLIFGHFPSTNNDNNGENCNYDDYDGNFENCGKLPLKTY